MKLPWTANKYIQYIQTKKYLEDLERSAEELRSKNCLKCFGKCSVCHVASLLELKA